jgi:DNA-binding phage protein
MENTEHALQEDDARNITWEANHQKIMKAIYEVMQYIGAAMPSITDISKATGLTRKTIYDHISGHDAHPAFKKQSAVFKMMEFDILMRISNQARRGDIQAAKLYLELTGKIQPKQISNNGASNTNIQINGITLNQQVIQHLSEEQIKQIEEIIKPVISIYDLQIENSLKS